MERLSFPACREANGCEIRDDDSEPAKAGCGSDRRRFIRAGKRGTSWRSRMNLRRERERAVPKAASLPLIYGYYI